MRHVLLGLGLAAVLVGCGSDDDDDDRVVVTDPTPPVVDTPDDPDPVDPDPVDETPAEITGSVSAPDGVVAQLVAPSSMQIVMNYFISPAAAAITGLSPVADATVNLIRIDNSGDQVGDVLATTTTIADGTYTLEVPADVSLAGDLIVEISSGVGGATMRAQAVAEEVNVSPVTEYILRSFISSGANLATLPKQQVADLAQEIEKFDLNAGADLDAALAALDETAGNYVAETVEVIAAEEGDSSGIAGEYRNNAFDWGLHDTIGGSATAAMDTWTTDITLGAGENGAVTFAIGEEQSSGAGLILQPPYLYIDIDEPELVDESFDTSITADGIINLQFEGEDDVEEDSADAQRWQPNLLRLQKALNDDIFFATAQNISTRYEAVDTDDDGKYDAIDNEKKLGDEIARGLEIFTKKPTDATNADAQGDFGRVYVGWTLYENGWMHVESEHNVLSFDGSSSASLSETVRPQLSSEGYEIEDEEGETVPYSLSSDGRFTFEGEISNVFLNDEYNFLVGTEFWEDESDDGVPAGDFSLTLGVRLPASTPTVADRVYRIMGTQLEMSDEVVLGVNQLRFGSTIEFTSSTTAELSGTVAEARLTGKTASIDIEGTTLDKRAVAVAVENDGRIELNADVPDGTLTFTGYLNEDGSIGVVQYIYTPDGASPIALGAAVMVEISK